MAYVYKCTHKIDKTFYIGSRWKNENTPELDIGHSYFTSSKVINKNNISEYDIEILKEFSEADDAWKYEQKLIEENFDDELILNRHYLVDSKLQFRNLGGYKLSESTKLRQRKPKSEKAKQNITAANRLRLSKEDERAKLRKPKSEITRQRMKEAQKRIGGLSKETGRKISMTMKERGIIPPSQKGKMRINNGTINAMVPRIDVLPEGWFAGYMKSNKTSVINYKNS
jgi:hypothetical protein